MRELAGWIGLALSIAGLIYYAGRLAERLDTLRRDFDKHEEEITTELREIRGMLACAVGGRRRYKSRSDAANDATP